MAGTVQQELQRTLGIVGDGPDSEPLLLELSINDPDTIAELTAHSEGRRRDEFAVTALRIGCLALRQARGQLDTDVIQRETKTMLAALERQLGEHSRTVQDRMAGTLREYFDPENGRFAERVRRLVDKDGDLERVLRAQVGGQDSELCRTLLAHVGEHSPLMQQLDPEQSQGLMACLRDMVAEQLKQQRDRVLEQFSLDNPGGALARLVDELSENHDQLNEKLQGKIDEVVKEFSLDEENSALSRLVRNVDRAQQTIAREFSMDNDGSAFSRLRGMLESTSQAIHDNLTLDDEQSSLARLKREMVTILSAQVESQSRFQEEVKLALGKMSARREEADRSTRHGHVFQDAVCEYLELHARRSGDVPERTGDSTGLIRNCKKGDIVLELGPDTRAAGAKIVIEAKEDASYKLSTALKEMEEARKNRDAQMGLFVFSRRCCPGDLKPFGLYGSDLVVIWDAEDATSDVYLEAAIVSARALCMRQRQQSAEQSADFENISKAVLEIEKQSGLLDEVTRLVETIKSNSDKILNRVRITRESLTKQVCVIREKTGDLAESIQTEPME